MVFEDYVAIVSLAFAVVFYIGYRWASNNVYLKHKDQKAWGGEGK